MEKSKEIIQRLNNAGIRYWVQITREVLQEGDKEALIEELESSLKQY